jgi:FkbM family methyltransferase
MAARGNTIRERFHPLYHARSLPILRGALEQCDVAAWAPVPGTRWRMRVRLVRHASHVLLSDGVEPTITAFMRAVCEVFEPRLCWDDGAYIGYYGVLLKSLNPNARVVMFEPDPENIKLIDKTLARASISGIEHLPVAVSDSAGPATFYVDPVVGATGTLEDGGETFSQRHWGRTHPIVVQTLPLDDLLPDADGLDLLKIDVEGHEERVVYGAAATLAVHRPFVVFECFHGGDEISELLEALDYMVLDAERLCRRAAESTNFVGIPSRYLDRQRELIERWGRIVGSRASRGGGV